MKSTIVLFLLSINLKIELIIVKCSSFEKFMKIYIK